MQPVPVSIISGFLGSGKTSLLNHLLANAKGRKLAALVNDFGALNIDSELIAAQNGNQISLANGCVCCSIGDDLTVALAQVMMQETSPDHILIEASGVADPARIAAFTLVDRELRLDGIITLVDARSHSVHARDPHIGDNYQRQIAAAHFLLMSKTDLVDAAALSALEAELAHQKPDTVRAPITHGVIYSDIILGLGQTDAVPAKPDVHHDFRQWAGHIPRHVSRQQLISALETLAPHVLRAKGVLQDEAGAYVLHHAGGHISTEDFDATPSGHFVLIGTPSLPNDATLRDRLICAGGAG